MSEFDDLDFGAGSDAAIIAGAALESEANAADAEKSGESHICLSCGASMKGVYCSSCGQKYDDMRRSSFLLARDFFQDTFGFDSRMWRTLALMAVSPGVVPKDYAHGKRSRFTPPVRLFLVVSFLFFLTIAFTNTLFIGLDIEFKKQENTEAASTTEAAEPADNAIVVAHDSGDTCNFQAQFKFFIKESDLDTDTAQVEKCLGSVTDGIQQEIENPEAADEFEVDLGDNPASAAEAVSYVERAFSGVSWAVSNPRSFNNAFNNWLPRVLFLMAPVLALFLTMFIRGRDALVFDHLVLSLYTHAAGFAIIGISLILAQLGMPHMGMVAFGAVGLYYLIAMKRAYNRGWIKTVWTVLVSGALYLTTLIIILMIITSNIIWHAVA